MSDTDIYKQREPLPYGSQSPKRPHRRRRTSAGDKPFDDHSRKRRSNNSGLRRLLHLYRKKDNEKVFWWAMLVIVVVFLGGLAIWQFVIREHLIHSQERKDDYLRYEQEVQEQPSPSGAELPAPLASE